MLMTTAFDERLALGATRDIGTALTRICMRHRSMENRLKTVSSALIDCLVLPLQEHAEDWMKRTNNLDKEHAREYKKTKNEIRKRSTDTIRLQKKVKKGTLDISAGEVVRAILGAVS